MTSSRHEILKLNVANVSVMLAVRLMLSSAISALFLSYYRLPTRENETPDCPWAVWGSAPNPRSAFGSILGSFFYPFRRPLEPHGHSGNAKICGLVSKMCKGSVSVMKTVKIAFPVGPWGSRGSPGGRKFENFEISFFFLVFRFV